MRPSTWIQPGFWWAYLLLSPGVVFGGGYMIPHQTARALGLSNALTAGVTDPSAVYYNPAALGEVDGNRIIVSGSYINVISRVENNGRTAVNNRDDNFIPTLFANYHIPETDFTVGLGTYVPFGLATEYDRAFTRFAAQDTELKTLFVTPAFSWRLSDYLSVGAGLSFVHASGVFSRSLCFDALLLDNGCATVGGPFEGRIRISDSANAFTYNIGLLVKPRDDVKVGFSYRGRSDIQFDLADVNFGGPFSLRKTKGNIRPLPLPPVIDVGIFWQINPQWGAEFVYEFTRWSELKTFGVAFLPATTFVPLGAPVASFRLAENWRNTSTLRLGSFYRLTADVELRAGIGVEETPIPGKTSNPAIPGANALTLNAGMGYAWNNFIIDLGYMAGFYEKRTVFNSEIEGLPATGILFLGAPGKDKHQAFNNFVSFTVGYKF